MYHLFAMILATVALLLSACLVAYPAVFAVDWRRRLALFFVPLFAFIVIAPAQAASNTAVNVDPVALQQWVNLGAAIVLAIGAAIWKVIDNNSPLKNTQAEALAHDLYTQLLTRGTQYGATQLDASITRVGSLDVGNAAVAAAANFVIAHGNDIAKAAGVDVETAEGQAKVVQSVTALLGTLLGTAAADQKAIYRIALPTSVAPVAPRPVPNSAN